MLVAKGADLEAKNKVVWGGKIVGLAFEQPFKHSTGIKATAGCSLQKGRSPIQVCRSRRGQDVTLLASHGADIMRLADVSISHGQPLACHVRVHSWMLTQGQSQLPETALVAYIHFSPSLLPHYGVALDTSSELAGRAPIANCAR